MNSMDEYLEKELSNIAFLELKTDSEVGNLLLPRKFKLPVIKDKFLKSLKLKEKDKINMEFSERIQIDYIIEGIIVYIGILKDLDNIETYIKILHEYTESPKDYIFYLASQDLKNNNIKQAVIKYRTVLVLDHKNTKALFNYGIALEILASIKNKENLELSKEFIELSTKQFEKILDLDEKFDLAYYKLGYHYKNYSQYLKASLIWKKFLLLSDNEELKNEVRYEIDIIDSESKMEAGITYLLYKDYEKALDNLLPLLDHYSNRWNLMLLLGQAYKGLGNIEESIKFYEKGIELNSEESDLYNDLGILYFEIGRFQDAKKTFSFGIREVKSDYKLYFNRALVNLELKNTSKAMEDMREALRLNPSDDNLKQYISELKKKVDKNY